MVINGENSLLAPVKIGVPRRTVLVPVLILIYINDLNTGLVREISKIADDTKLGANAENPAAVESLHQDLDRIV